MKKVIIILVVLSACTDLFSQSGYFCKGNFNNLTPSNSDRYYVQTRSSESKAFLEKIVNMEKKQNKSPKSVYPISENSFFVSSKNDLFLITGTVPRSFVPQRYAQNHQQDSQRNYFRQRLATNFTKNS